jgi:hypothetical protein
MREGRGKTYAERKTTPSLVRDLMEAQHALDVEEARAIGEELSHEEWRGFSSPDFDREVGDTWADRTALLLNLARLENLTLAMKALNADLEIKYRKPDGVAFDRTEIICLVVDIQAEDRETQKRIIDRELKYGGWSWPCPTHDHKEMMEWGVSPFSNGVPIESMGFPARSEVQIEMDHGNFDEAFKKAAARGRGLGLSRKRSEEYASKLRADHEKAEAEREAKRKAKKERKQR